MDASEPAWLFSVMQTGLPKFVVATAMRNEGPFIVEWVVWYRMLGFEVIVATNDCTDRSPQLLEALADAGWVRHISHSPPIGTPPQKAAHKLLSQHRMVRDADWVLTCDVDEFLVLHATDTILEFVGTGPWDYLGVAFNWKTFGSGGWKRYQPGLVHEQFRRAGITRLPVNRPFKSMFRQPKMFNRIGAHTPHGFKGDWTDDENAWLNSDGREIPQFRNPDNHPVRMVEPEQITHETAQMNHYVLRSVEHYEAKKGTPSAAALADRYDDDFFERRDRNGMLDITATRFTPIFRPLWETAMAAPGVERLHHLCCADYIERLCKHHGTEHRTDTRWIDAMTSAG